MPYAPATTADLVVRYERMVERHLDVSIAMVALNEEPVRVPGLDFLRERVARLGAPVVVADVREEEPLPADSAHDAPTIGAYVGWPLVDGNGRTTGALCAVDERPRQWTREDLDSLADLADACSGELVHRRGREEAERQADRARELNRRSRVFLALSEGLSATRTLDDIAYAVERVAVEQLDCMHGGIWLLRSARDAAGTDQMHYVSDPSSGWGSASRNATLGVRPDNPLGEVLISGRSLVFANREEQNARFAGLDVSQQVGETRYFMPLGLGRTFGVLVLLWEEEHRLSAEHRITIATLASYVSQAVQRAELLEERERVSHTLQTAMLPQLPEVRGMDVAARYRPAAVHDRIGGDWYDAVVTHSGATDLMIGDVAGHDIAAAAVMGEVRSMLRAFSFGHDDSPAENVARLDEALEKFGIDRFASLLYVRVEEPDDSGSRRLRWTNAGHFPPLLVCPDGTTRLLHDPGGNDLVLGVDASGQRYDQECTVPPGSILVLYTDGLVERREECLSVGLERLRESAARHHGHPPGALLDALIDDLVGSEHEDDIAVLAAHFTS